MTIAPLPVTMRAVVLKNAFEVTVEERPIPVIEEAGDVIVKVLLSGLCGSDLHWYRGHAKSDYNFILGHEVVGQIVRTGSGVHKFKEGDLVVVPFSLSCGSCFYCEKKYTARCLFGRAFGTPRFDGGQAEYIKLGMADTSLFRVPKDLPTDLMVLMTDIIPTGFSVAKNARNLLDSDGLTPSKAEVCVVIGCGPVGLCAISSACTMFSKVYATDIVPQRLEAAKRHGAIALPFESLKKEVDLATEGRGADAILEVVGHPSAFTAALEMVRPFGVLSSCGVHNSTLALVGPTAYGKNIRLQFGRCSVPKYFDGALQILKANRELFASFVENKIRLEDAPEYYRLFEQNKIAKTVFVVD